MQSDKPWEEHAATYPASAIAHCVCAAHLPCIVATKVEFFAIFVYEDPILDANVSRRLCTESSNTL